MLPLVVTRIPIDGQQERGWHAGSHSAATPFPRTFSGLQDTFGVRRSVWLVKKILL